MKGRNEWRVYVGSVYVRTANTEDGGRIFAQDERANPLNAGKRVHVRKVYVPPKRLTREQEEAKVLGEHVRSQGVDFPVWIRVDWTKSRTWGYCPAVRWNGRKAKAGSASGCGYDKESAAMNEALAYVAPGPNAHGCGMPALIERLRALGWSLVKVGSGETWDAYHLSPVTTEGGES